MLPKQEQQKNLIKLTNKTEINNITDEEIKVIFIKMLTSRKRRVEKLSENFKKRDKNILKISQSWRIQ